MISAGETKREGAGLNTGPKPKERREMNPTNKILHQDTAGIQAPGVYLKCDLCGNISADVHEESGFTYRYACADQDACEQRRFDMAQAQYKRQFTNTCQRRGL
jgi:hypothetical protein